jgi:hypothetical protein
MGELIAKARERLTTLLTELFEDERKRFEALVPAPGTMRELAAELRAAADGIAT